MSMHSRETSKSTPAIVPIWTSRVIESALKDQSLSVSHCFSLYHSSVQPHSSSIPAILTFHGSGSTTSPSWDNLIARLADRFRVFVYDRASPHLVPAQVVPGMIEAIETLDEMKDREFILIAHSYGGAFAKLFLMLAPKKVLGMVLVETGQEGGLDPGLEERLYHKQALGDKPLVVVRGNSLIYEFRKLSEREAAIIEQGLPLSTSLVATRTMLEVANREDERLKRQQLRLSRTNLYVHLPNVSHNVIAEAPDMVAEHVRWVEDHCSSSSQESELKKEKSEKGKKWWSSLACK